MDAKSSHRGESAGHFRDDHSERVAEKRFSMSCRLGLSLRICCWAVALWFFPGVAPTATAAPQKNALRAYVEQRDSTFAWKEVKRRDLDGVTAIRLDLTSQTWRDNVWRHQILVVRPEKVRNPDIALLFITGDGDVEKEFDMLRTLALRAGAIAAIINKVPNQPLYGNLEEDALIAYTFDNYLKTGDRTWPLLFPMAKSAIRGMDAVQAFAKNEYHQKITRFVTSGASKRGWTTWLAAAADPRVVAIAPIVIDMLNMKAQTQWAQQMYGKQSEEIQDYADHDLINRMDEPRMIELRSWVDPYSYRASYKLPKLLLLGCNDPYWVVDSLRHYWSELLEPKLVFQTPNAGHDLGGGADAKQTLAAYYQVIADRQKLPRMTWKFGPSANGLVTLDVTLSQPAKALRLWTADSADRDFRKDKWSSTELPSNPATHVTVRVETPASGYRAYMVEAELTSSTGETYKLSTEARVTPDGPPKRQ
jgi:PhoPQ-activated pathogenicity-related protein